MFEILTGVLADAQSKRLSVIIGVFVMSSAYLIEQL